MASIGKLAVIITANATKLYSGLTGVGSRLKSFATSAKSTLTSGIGAALGPVGTIVKGAVGSIFDDLPGKFQELAAKVKQASQDAARFGVPVEQLMGLQYAAERSGIEVESLNKALFHL